MRIFLSSVIRGFEAYRDAAARASVKMSTEDQLCRAGRLSVLSAIGEEKPLQITPDAILKGRRPKTALRMALETGQHSLASLLLKIGQCGRSSGRPKSRLVSEPARSGEQKTAAEVLSLLPLDDEL